MYAIKKNRAQESRCFSTQVVGGPSKLFWYVYGGSLIKLKRAFFQKPFIENLYFGCSIISTYLRYDLV